MVISEKKSLHAKHMHKALHKAIHSPLKISRSVTPWSLYFVFSLYIWSGQGVTWGFVVVFRIGVFVLLGL
jgi:hypothetical protein